MRHTLAVLVVGVVIRAISHTVCRMTSPTVDERETSRVREGGEPVRRISIIVPMLNEAEHIETFVDDVAAQDFAGEVELLVADGASTDESPALLRRAADRAGIDLTIIPNPARWVAPGLNLCLERASGDLLVRLDCHTRYPTDYLRRCADAARETMAWQVGGLLVPKGRTHMERAVACATDSPFGGVNWTRWGRTLERVDVDTVYCGAYRPDAFARAGLFDESLVRNQDDELALRIRRSGGRIVLDPRIRQYYVPRGSFRRVFRQYYEYGLWKVPVMLKHRQVVSARSLAPVALVGSMLALGLLGTRSRAARRLLAAELAAYAASAVAFAVVSVEAHDEDRTVLPRTIAVYPTVHFAYGLGFLRGCLRALRRR